MCLYLIKRLFYRRKKEKGKKRSLTIMTLRPLLRGKQKTLFVVKWTEKKVYFSLSRSNRKRHDAIKISFDETNFQKTCPEVGLSRRRKICGRRNAGMPIKTLRFSVIRKLTRKVCLTLERLCMFPVFSSEKTFRFERKLTIDEKGCWWRKRERTSTIVNNWLDSSTDDVGVNAAKKLWQNFTQR